MNDLVLSRNTGKIYYDESNQILGFEPCNMFFGYTYHSYMIPPYLPKNVLILGYGMGTISGLLRLIYGYSFKITGVDIVEPINRDLDTFIFQDAREYMEYCVSDLIKVRYDYVVVDLWENGNVCDFVFSEKFAKYMSQIVKTSFSLNIKNEDVKKLKNMYNYFTFLKFDIVHGNNIIHWNIKNDDKEKAERQEMLS